MNNSLYRTYIDDLPKATITDHCIVLDLDQTLIATQDSVDTLSKLKILSDPKLLSLRNRSYYITIDDVEKPGIGSKYDFWGVTRPHVEEFLIFCFSYFKIVAVWSAGKRPYVEAIVDHLFRDLPQPHIVFSHDDIILNNKNEVEKPLTKMINLNDITKRYMSLENTFAIDDNNTTFVHNPKNAVYIPPYEPSVSVNALSRDDPTLLQLKYWFLQPEVMDSLDIRQLDKKKIFKTSIDDYKSILANLPGNMFNY